MSNKNRTTKRGIGLLSLVFLLFLTLKLAQIGLVATWSWWWVFAPIWIPVAGALMILIIYAILVIVSKN